MLCQTRVESFYSLLLTPSQLEKHSCSTESRPINIPTQQIIPLITNHILTPFSIESPQVNVLTILNIHHTLLTSLSPKTYRRIIILEEIVQARAINENAGGIDEARPPGSRTISLRAGGEVGVAPGFNLWCEGDERVGVALEVGCFCLDDAGERVTAVAPLVVVEGVVFCACAVEPVGAIAFDKEAAAIIDGDLVAGVEV